MNRMNRETALKNPACRRLVKEVLALTDRSDIVDAIADLKLVVEILQDEWLQKIK